MIKLKDILLEMSDDAYRGNHTAPDKESGCPLYDMTRLYPEDIYSSNAARFYGDDQPEYSDQESIGIIHSARNRPNFRVKIYRAVPNINKDVETEIRKYASLLMYLNKFGFLPMNNFDSTELISIFKYDNEKIKQFLNSKIEKLLSSKKPNLKIETGNWTTINYRYAKFHGETNLLGNYKIISKTVKAKDLYSDGSIHEWGYDP
jgi:hypothetical protein